MGCITVAVLLLAGCHQHKDTGYWLTITPYDHQEEPLTGSICIWRLMEEGFMVPEICIACDPESAENNTDDDADIESDEDQYNSYTVRISRGRYKIITYDTLHKRTYETELEIGSDSPQHLGITVGEGLD